MSIAATTIAAPATPALRTDTLADTVVIMLMLTAVQRLIGFVRGMLFCRWLDPMELGEWDLAFAFLVMAAPFTVLGLPGTFGRYVAHYRQRGQLRAFLFRTTLLSAVLATVGISLMSQAGPWFSSLIFGRPDRVELVQISAAALAVVVVHNFIVELFTALRMFRVVSGLQFSQSVLFALFGTGLVLAWQPAAASIVLAYAGACLVGTGASVYWLRRMWQSLPPAEPLAHRTLLVKLAPFALWVWVGNWLANLFEVADRFMLVHFSGLDAAEQLVQVGNYHSSRVVPMLLVGVAAMLASVALPHLSHDWETGRRDAVSQCVNLMFKLAGFAMTLGAAIILLAAPLIFDYAFAGKYSGGLAILPWTLTYCIWFGLIGIAQNYLWCAEKLGLSTLAILVGLVVNICLNLLLLPRLGLQGAVLATAAANLVALLFTCGFAHLCGLKFDQAIWLVFAAPALLPLGPWPVLGLLVVCLIWAVRGDGLLNRDERQQIAAACGKYLRYPRTSWNAAG